MISKFRALVCRKQFTRFYANLLHWQHWTITWKCVNVWTKTKETGFTFDFMGNWSKSAPLRFCIVQNCVDGLDSTVLFCGVLHFWTSFTTLQADIKSRKKNVLIRLESEPIFFVGKDSFFSLLKSVILEFFVHYYGSECTFFRFNDLIRRIFRFLLIFFHSHLIALFID